MALSTSFRGLCRLQPLSMFCFRTISVQPKNSKNRRSVGLSGSIAEKEREFDGVPEQYKMIYRADMRTFLYFAQAFTPLMSVTLAGINGYFLVKGFDVGAVHSIGSYEVEPTTLSTLLLLDSLLIGHVTIFLLTLYRVPIRIYTTTDMDEYLPVFLHPLIPSKTYVHAPLQANSGFKHDVNSFFAEYVPWNMQRYGFPGSRYMFLGPQFFATPAHMNNLIQDS